MELENIVKTCTVLDISLYVNRMPFFRLIPALNLQGYASFEQ